MFNFILVLFLKKNKLNILNILFIHEVYTYGIIPRIAVNFGLEGTKVSRKSLIKFKKRFLYWSRKFLFL